MDDQDFTKPLQRETHLDPNEIASQQASDNQFAVSKIPAHVHNGVDSLPIDAQFLVYTVPSKIFVTTTTPSNPTAKYTGALAVVNGILLINNGTNWVKVSSQ